MARSWVVGSSNDLFEARDHGGARSSREHSPVVWCLNVHVRPLSAPSWVLAHVNNGWQGPKSHVRSVRGIRLVDHLGTHLHTCVEYMNCNLIKGPASLIGCIKWRRVIIYEST